MSKSLFTALLIISFNGIADESVITDVKGQLSSNYLTANSSKEWQHQALLRYIPDFTIEKTLSNDYLLDFNVSVNTFANYQSDPDSDFSSNLSLYRINSQFKTSQSDIRLGLQKINFGPALLLRSLRWFDQLNPTDPLQLTDGVYGIRYRYFFLNNANIWSWVLYGNKDLKGYERVASKENTPELGARLQYPLESGELGIAFHSRQVENLGFSNESVGKDLLEKRFAMDGRWDLELGIWFEYVLIDQGAGSKSDTNWVNRLTTGADYTFAIGNGLHIVAEHLINAISDTAITWDQKFHTSALQLSYPIGLLDAVSLIQMYSWTQEQSFHSLRWTRTYDNWMLSLNAFISPDQPGNNMLGLSGNGIQATVVFNH